ncbi:MAG: ribose-phosphate diphosphokinase [Anaerolineae bacterium]|jgi:ribose-phosphate pyrophosphokinase|nr:ribose-phosphate pyrophosphokinase [Chloroflexota bacterium]
MEAWYRVLQSRWARGGEWRNWGLVYQTEPGGALLLHHNMDELQGMLYPATQRLQTLPPELASADAAFEDLAETCRLLPEIHHRELSNCSASAMLNELEAEVLGLAYPYRQAPREDDIRIFSGRANRPLAQAVAHRLGLPLGGLAVKRFPDSELHVQLEELVRKRDVFLIQPCTAPVNEHLVELLMIIDALRRASAEQITAILPYYPYARQERMAQGREAIGARVVASMLEASGVARVIYVDIHADAIQGFFTVPVDWLQAYPIFCRYFAQQPYISDAVVVSPDVGRARLAGLYSRALGVPLVVMQKRRDGNGRVETTHVVGDVRDKVPIVIDDVVASGSVLGQLPELFRQGARPEVHLAITHPVLLPSALQRLDAEWISELVVADTVLVPPPKHHPKLKIVSVAPMLAYAIQGIHRGTSISPLWSPQAPEELGL